MALRAVLHERRTDRSSRCHGALTRWLREMTRRYGARASVLGTIDGLPIASFGVGDALSLAALGAELASEARMEVPGVDAERIDLFGGHEVVLTVCGTLAPTDDEVGRDVRRILRGC